MHSIDILYAVEIMSVRVLINYVDFGAFTNLDEEECIYFCTKRIADNIEFTAVYH